jgi:hypothetical protein
MRHTRAAAFACLMLATIFISNDQFSAAQVPPRANQEKPSLPSSVSEIERVKNEINQLREENDLLKKMVSLLEDKVKMLEQQLAKAGGK